MRNTFKALLALTLAACAALAYADPPGRVGRLNYAAGAVSFAPGEAPGEWNQAQLNRPLTGGDRLWADRDGRAEMHVGSTALRMAPLTSVDVLHLDDDRIQMRLAQGTLNVRVRELDQNDVVEIATPGGAVLLREPGSYRIGTDPNTNTTRIAVNFGRAELVMPSQTLTVPTGQVAVVPDGAAPVFEIAGAAADEFDRWATERDRREDRPESTRYVSRDMTGYEDLDQHGSWRTLPEYGAVWVPTRVAAGWAPYRYGHWAWISPWGWTWVDDAPWGFAPFHYGRWVHVHDYWAWAPGPIARRPVYAPALVAFVGGPRWSVSVTNGPAVGWFPLGWREPYHPWYRASPAYVRNVNVTHVTNVTNVTNITYVNRERVTVVPRQSFVSARPVGQSRVNVAAAELARAEVIRDRSPAEPGRASFTQNRPGQRPPAQATAREVLSVNAPASTAAREVPGVRGPREADAESRVRVIPRERVEARRAERPGQPNGQPERPAGAAAQPQAPAGGSAPAAAAAPAAAPAAAAAASAPAGSPAQPARERRQAPAAAPAAASPSAAASAPPAAAPAAAPARERRAQGDSGRPPTAPAARTEQNERALDAQRAPEPQRPRAEPQRRPEQRGEAREPQQRNEAQQQRNEAQQHQQREAREAQRAQVQRERAAERARAEAPKPPAAAPPAPRPQTHAPREDGGQRGRPQRDSQREGASKQGS